MGLYNFMKSRYKFINYNFINPSCGASISRDYITLPYLTIRRAQTVVVNDLSCLKHTEQSTSVTEIVA